MFFSFSSCLQLLLLFQERWYRWYSYIIIQEGTIVCPSVRYSYTIGRPSSILKMNSCVLSVFWSWCYHIFNKYIYISPNFGIYLSKLKRKKLHKLQNIIVKIGKHVCQRWKIYLSKLENMFVQIRKYICANCKIFVYKIQIIFVQLGNMNPLHQSVDYLLSVSAAGLVCW